jgi:hypothetical protein
LDLQRFAKQLFYIGQPDQTPAGFLERGVVGNMIQLDGFSQAGAINKELHNGTIVDLQERLENQTRKQLRSMTFSG